MTASSFSVPAFVDAERSRDWVREALRRIEADFQRSADTHLIPLALPGFDGIDVYLKDESSHPTGSLKHRLARSLFLYALCNGWLREGSTVVESSSGSTAVSEAYFARLLGLPFVAVMPATVSAEKIRAIEFQGGRCHLVQDPTRIYAESQRLAAELGGHYMDQFTYAERATDWRGNNNIAESIFVQMARERHPVPRWIVCSAGTGGTLATMGRFVRYGRHQTGVCGADAERSVFFDYYLSGDASLRIEQGSRIEGIGRPRVEASFLPRAIDAMVKLPDLWSIAAMQALSARLGRPVGASTGTNLLAALACARQMRQRGERGSIVTLLCDGGERYRHSYHDDHWLQAQGLVCDAEAQALAALMQEGRWPEELLTSWRLAGALLEEGAPAGGMRT
ncbi:PLP-dependent cysteine synthase family protein [Paucibacter sp. APW11]|uniref:L-cysteine desulfhydrase Cds1 n=1 Tax=Roseateles aquae TaxID=3077235 RepID=A0ABU3P987_9BURK|nr:PLP-dependent cysteine synthase family protein [Paucibacter sp. APW11]MDT8999122.1 PLP-dependent cysteine synthase family protein [Paucibacter sp. APW11]